MVCLANLAAYLGRRVPLPDPEARGGKEEVKGRVRRGRRGSSLERVQGERWSDVGYYSE